MSTLLQRKPVLLWLLLIMTSLQIFLIVCIQNKQKQMCYCCWYNSRLALFLCSWKIHMWVLLTFRDLKNEVTSCLHVECNHAIGVYYEAIRIVMGHVIFDIFWKYLSLLNLLFSNSSYTKNNMFILYTMNTTGNKWVLNEFNISIN